LAGRMFGPLRVMARAEGRLVWLKPPIWKPVETG